MPLSTHGVDRLTESVADSGMESSGILKLHEGGSDPFVKYLPHGQISFVRTPVPSTKRTGLRNGKTEA